MSTTPPESEIDQGYEVVQETESVQLEVTTGHIEANRVIRVAFNQLRMALPWKNSDGAPTRRKILWRAIEFIIKLYKLFFISRVPNDESKRCFRNGYICDLAILLPLDIIPSPNELCLIFNRVDVESEI
ncbi:hypothetical protein GCK72_008330 [Caenorhabditis remanei]|uniref:BHLH domain-containing protein n=1 Tax=Caenorhabditis remanei TaxID=31234 RepID=A0A6A5GZY4_CAERE|nr:hypothetical protein GCK72_008330 [Caenorhabditis remanei]KAF1760084.1 hypothetical protein GCK72_008330 [Caenorhabditis remanei]